MRKKTKSFALTLTTRVRAAMLLIAMLCCATGARAQEIVTIGEGTATSNTNPIGTYYNYSITEQLYTADEIGTAGTISSVSFYYMGNADKGLPITMYMKHVDEADLASAGITLADAEQVFSGTLSVTTTAGWVTIELGTPFEYDGESNLLIGVVKDYLYYFSGQTWQGTATTATMARYTQSDSAGPYDTSTVPGTEQTNRPNIKIGITPGIDCPKPNNFVASNITAHTAVLTWTTEASDIRLQYKKASEENWSTADIETGNTYTLSGLDPETEYQARVQAHSESCGNDPDTGDPIYSAFREITFTTDVACPAPTNLAVTDGSITTSGATVTWEGTSDSYVVMIGEEDLTASADFETGDLSQAAFTTTTSYPFTVVENTHSGAYCAKSENRGVNGTTSDMVLEVTLSNDAILSFSAKVSSENGWDKAYFSIDNTVQSNLNGISGNGNWIDYSYLLTAGTHTLHWYYSKDGSGASNDDCFYVDDIVVSTGVASWTEYPTGDQTYSFDNLTPETDYQVKVKGNCGDDGYSQETAPVRFTTLPTCIKPTDVTVSNVTTHEATISWTSNADAWQIMVNDDEENLIDVTETTYNFTGLAAETAFSVKVRTNCGGDDFSKWNNVTFTTAIAAPVPTNVAVSNVTKNSATVSWVSDATSFNVQYKATSAEEWQTVTATASPITITGLTPETEYEVQVQGNYGDLDGLSAWSAAVTFTTDVAFPSPKAVAANHVTATKADVSWTGNDDATSYNLRYAIDLSFFEDFENGLDRWTLLVNGEGTGWQTIDATRIDGGSNYNGNYVGMARSYEGGEDITGDNWMITPQMTIGNTMTYWAINDGRDDHQYDETYDVCVSTSSNNPDDFVIVQTFTTTPSSWEQITIDLSAYDGQQGYIAFHHHDSAKDMLLIDDVTIAAPSSTIDWMTVNDVTNPCTIEGLSPETKYSVEVQAVYEGGESTWAPTSFTTLAVDAIPFNLQADDITGTTATLSWDGAQDSYNVRYHSVYYFNPFNTDEDRAGWTSSKSIYGTDDTVYNIPEVNNYFLSMGWESTAEDFIYSPELPAYPSGSTLEFYHFYLNEANTFQVGYSTTTNDATAFTWSSPIAATVSYQNGAYTVKYSQTLPDGVKYVAFKATASSQNKSIFIDDFKIYKGASDNEWTETISNVDANTLAVTGLTSDTEYEWQVQGNLTNGTTKWIPAFFTTTADIELANDATNNSTLIANNADKVANVTLSGRTLYKDGEWNTICLPFDLVLEGSPLEGATAKTLTNATVTNNGEYTHVELTFGDDVTTLQAGVPYIIKWEASQENIVDPTFTGVLIKDVDEEVRTLSFADYQVQFIGYYDAFPITPGDVDIFYMTAGNELKHTGVSRTLKSCRAYFQFSEEALKARQFVLNFGDGNEATGIVSTTNFSKDTNAGWYTVNGMKLGMQPKRKGVYIQNGRKVVIK